MDTNIYLNKANQNPFPNKPTNNNSNKYVLIYFTGSSADVIDLLHDRIRMIANDGFVMGIKGSSMAIIETDLQPTEIRSKLMSDDCSRAEIFVMSFNYVGYASWLNSSNSSIVKSFFENK